MYMSLKVANATKYGKWVEFVILQNFFALQ